MTDDPKDQPELAVLAALAGEIVEAATLARTMAVALTAELPGLATGSPPRSPEELAKVDAAVEASFDNMPV